MVTTQALDSLVGKTVRWTFTEGPFNKATFEHTFHPNGAVTWRGVSGPSSCESVTESTCAVEKVSDDVSVISYQAKNGFTLTVVLNRASGTLIGFASNDKQWFKQAGTFEVL